MINRVEEIVLRHLVALESEILTKFDIKDLEVHYSIKKFDKLISKIIKLYTRAAVGESEIKVRMAEIIQSQVKK